MQPKVCIKIPGLLERKAETEDSWPQKMIQVLDKSVCSLSPAPFTLYLDEAIKQWQRILDKNFVINGKKINSLLFADDLIIVWKIQNANFRKLHINFF